jgi:GNAT superfamily N-acetyltransferase
MTEQYNLPTTPALPGISWRILQPGDQNMITALAAACQAADGGQALIAADLYLRAEGAGATIGAFEGSDRLIACAAVWPEQTPPEQRANILGQVHPDQRGCGIGTFLLSWSIAQARALLAAMLADHPRVLRLTT